MKTANVIRHTPRMGIGGTILDIHAGLKSGEIVSTKRGYELASSTRLFASDDSPPPLLPVLDLQALLGYAAPHYKISKDPVDYVLVPVPITITDTPNRNGVSFPARELAEFAPDYGMPYFKTWVGKPSYLEHANKDITQAKGIIVDTMMNPVRGRPGYFKVVNLLAFDRTKDRMLYDSICNREYNAYSMGAYPTQYRCSYCQAEWAPQQMPACRHIFKDRINFYVLNGKLVYKECLGPVGFETSLVASPAWRIAHSDHISILDPNERAHFQNKDRKRANT